MTDETIAERVRSALERVEGPDGPVDLTRAGRLRGLSVEDGAVRFELALAPDESPSLVGAARQAASGVSGVSSVRVEMAAVGAAYEEEAPERPVDAGNGEESPRPRPDLAQGRSLPVMGQGSGQPGGEGDERSPDSGTGPRPRAADREASSRHPREAPPLESVSHVVAVSSGKGGVGKSTVATNLAAAWADAGHRVGLLDADIYGPDIPTMFGVHDRPRMEGDEVVPLEAHGVKLMSLGFLVDEDTPAIWRGPIIQGVVRQFLQQVRWGELDYLVVDLPPGTGDAQLSLAQLVRLDGGVFVTTPQDVAVGGVLKGIRMFERLEIPVTGIVENMRGFVCPDCGAEHDLFGSGGGEKLAASLGLPFLGAVPLGMAVREEGDRGLPTVLGRPGSPEAEALRAVAEAARARVDAHGRAEGGEERDAPRTPAAAPGGGGGEPRPPGG